MVLTKWSGRRTGRSGAGEEPDEVEGALEGGTRVCGDEAEVRICEAALSRTEEECHPTVRGVRTGESVLGAEKTVASGTGLAPERRLLITGEPPKQAEDRKKPNPSACTGLAEHLLPRRHGLIQSFPSEEKKITLEHVLPQNPASEWNIKPEIVESLVDRLGNLALL